MPALVVLSITGFAGYAALLPVAPLWAVHGGANEAESGLVNGVLLLATILTQLFVPGALRRFGWGPVLVAGMVFLGIPPMLYALSDALGPVLALSALRGVGFGVITVTGSSAAGLLVEPARRGEAIGVYGFAVALPNLVLLPLGPWLAQHAGYLAVFAISSAPLLGIPAAIRLARAVHQGSTAHLGPEAAAGFASAGARRWAAYLRLVRPTVLLLGVTLAGGAVLTFTPQMVASPLLTTAGLFLLGLVTALTRWYAGLLADRRGAERFVWPLVLATTIGLIVVALAVREPAATSALTLLVGMVLIGFGYGALQNLTLVMAFGSVSRAHHNLASAVWNIGFDAGTGIGSILVGAVALRTSFSVALLSAAVLTLLTLPLALRRAPRS
ncbi:MAG: MFS transporter [Micrococcales bacterium]|nr:MFS transporter [Micrococcales bacterium]